MKKLTKTEKENRLRNFRKVKDIILYVSLALNTLFLVCCVVVGCSNKSIDRQQQNNNMANNIVKNMLVDRNNAVEVATNQDWQCYDLRHLVTEKINENNFYWGRNDVFIKNVDYQFSLICGNEVLVGANAIYIEYDLRLTSLSTDNGILGVCAYDSVNDPYQQHPVCCVYYHLGLRNGALYPVSVANWWPGVDVPPYDSDKGFYITYAPVTFDENYMYDWIIPNFFNPIKYIDLDLSSNWNPYALFKSNFFVNSSFIGIHKLTGFTQFVSNGKLFDNIYIMVSQAFYYQRADGSVLHVGSSTINTSAYISSVYFHNSYSGDEIEVMSTDYTYIDDNVCIIENSLHFNNYAFSSIRLFDINLNEKCPYFNDYVNFDMFNLQFNYSSSTGGNAGLGNVFGLLRTAFSGLAGLFSIVIVPGITLGMLIFLPLVGGIIFAIVKIIKK